MKKEIKFCRIYYKNMVDISRETSERNGIKTIVDNDGVLRLNEKHIEEGLDHKNRQELDNKSRKQCNIIFIDERLGIKVIMDYRITPAHKVRTWLGFKQYNVILTKSNQCLQE